jgi:uncharacterized protein YifE (UPF0438 family)
VGFSRKGNYDFKKEILTGWLNAYEDLRAGELKPMNLGE